MIFHKHLQGWSKNLLILSNLSLYFTAIATWISIPESLYLNLGLTLFAILMTLGMVYWQREAFKIYWEGEYFRNLTSSMVSVFLVFCILGILNYWSYKRPLQKDITRGEVNSLSPKTLEVLDNIKDSINFKVFSRRGEQASIIPLLELYRSHKNDIVIELHDPDLRPELVKQYKIQHYGTVLVESGKRQHAVLAHNEREITKALLKVGRKKDFVFYFTTGHQELDWENQDKNGLSLLRSELGQDFYSLRPLHLASLSSIVDERWPNDIDGLIIWGPKTPFFPHELKIIESYVDQGGRLLVAIDPDFNKNPMFEFVQLLQKWGIRIHNDLVVDVKSYVNGSNFTVPLISHYNDKHPITKNFKEQTFFPLATSLESIARKEERWEVAELLHTNPFPASWSEKSFNEVLLERIHFTVGTDKEGPVGLMLAAKEKVGGLGNRREGRIVAVGNSTFVQNVYSPYRSNFQLFNQALSWLADDELLLVASAKSRPSSINFMLSAPQVGIIFYFSLIFGPLILLILAFYFYKKKQKL